MRNHLAPFFHRLAGIQERPEAVALGFALGVFLGFTPLFGLKTILALGLAWATRGSRLAAVLGVTLHDLALPFMPLLLWAEYDVGFWLTNHPHHLPSALPASRPGFHELLSWTTFVTTGWPLLLGSVVLGFPVAFAAFFVTRGLLRTWHSRMTQQ